jgi:anti-sigma regulatory factor (Ser/Thr protein kinase)
MKYKLLGGLLFYSTFLLSQSTKLDSINEKLAKAQPIDSSYTKLLIQKSVILIEENNSLSKEVAFLSLSQARRIKSPLFIAKATRLIGDVYMNVEPVNYDSSKYYYLTAISLFSKINEKKILPEIYFNLGLADYYLGDTSQCYLNFARGIKAAQEVKDNHYLITILRSKGVIKQNTANYFDAITLYNEALILAKDKKDLHNQTILLTDLSTAYFILNRYKESINYALEGLALNANSPNKLQDVINYTSIALSYKKLFDFASAEKYYLKALDLATKITDKTDRNLQLFTLNMLLGNLYNSANKYNKADSMYKISSVYLNITKQLNDYTSFYINKSINDYDIGNTSLTFQGIDSALKYAVKSQSNRNIGRVYQRKAEVFLSEIEKGKFNISNNSYSLKNALDSALFLAKQVGDVELEFFSVKSLAKLYGLLGNYRQAYLYKDSASILSDSLFTEQKRAETQNTIFNFELEKQQVESKLKLENEAQKRSTLVLVSLLVIVLLGLIFLFYKRRRDSIQIQKDLANKAKISETEMKLLRLQLNPHFIFNSLNSIADFIQKNNMTEADNYLTKFAKLMRGTLESSEEKEIPLKEELDMIDLYIQLEARRLGNTISYEINVDQSVDKDNTLVPPLILQPFVENSIWHGLSNKKDGGKIVIDIKLEHNMLAITIEDNGVGRNLGNIKATNKKSFGVSLTQERLALLNATKGVSPSLEFKELNPGTGVILKLPLIIA